MVFAFGFAAIREISNQIASSKVQFENVETLSDIELPEIIVGCSSDPTTGGWCWKSKYENDDERYGMFLGCKFLGNPQTCCTGNIYIGN